MRTIFDYLTNAEILRIFDDKRSKSSVIDTLCRRLEKIEQESIREDAEHETACPVCAAKLHADYEHKDGKFVVSSLP